MLVGSPATKGDGRRLQEQREPWADIEQPVERQHLATSRPCGLILVDTAANPQGESHSLSYLQGQHASIPGSPQQTRQAQHPDSIAVQNTMQSDKARSTPITQNSQNHRAGTVRDIVRGVETSRCCIPATSAAHAQPEQALRAPQLMAGPADRRPEPTVSVPGYTNRAQPVQDPQTAMQQYLPTDLPHDQAATRQQCTPLTPSFAANGPPSEPHPVCQPPGVEAGGNTSQARLGCSASNMSRKQLGVTAAHETAMSYEMQQTQNGQVPSKGAKSHKWTVQKPDNQLSELEREKFHGKAELALEVEEKAEHAKKTAAEDAEMLEALAELAACGAPAAAGGNARSPDTLGRSSVLWTLRDLLLMLPPTGPAIYR